MNGTATKDGRHGSVPHGTGERHAGMSPGSWRLLLGMPSKASVRRMTALARAELTLILRNRTALFMALAMPVGMVLVSYVSAGNMDAVETSLSIGEMVLTGGIGFVLLLVAYFNPITSYVARREERVLKRLRTGELTDGEILTGTALPSVVLALGQIAVLVVSGVLLLEVGLPEQPVVLVLGVLLGVVMMVGLAALTAAFTKTVESAQITSLPFFMLSALGSGLFVPLDAFPDGMANVFRALPMTPVIELVRGGWLGGLSGGELRLALLLALAWTVASVFAVRRWFRWDARQ
ncbi:ABC transporter permease [Streptomyces sp. NPDC059853]|uniref:ABC transporter permease n=1 Tax=Streptomyces sp. NPDC059853 TaxID=3346973 RepID=UPI00364CA420